MEALTNANPGNEELKFQLLKRGLMTVDGLSVPLPEAMTKT